MIRRCLGALSLSFSLALLAGEAATPMCGGFTAPPRASANSATARICGPADASRNYTSRYSGLAYELLAKESDACFVPDEYYKLMDSLIDDVLAVIGDGGAATADRARRVSTTIGEVLVRRGFAYYTPIDTLGDTFERRQTPDGSALYVFDCDTSTIIYLTIAENLGLRASMVEIEWPSGDSGHFYVRWHLADGAWLDWDTNGRYECQTPSDQPRQLGKALTRDEAVGYSLTLSANALERKGDYRKAIADLRQAQKLYPNSATAANNFAWLVATRDFPGRMSLGREALKASKRAVKLVNKPNHLDTLACVYALVGNFDRAIATIEEAARREPTDTFRDHRDLLRLRGPNCTGL